MPLLGGRQILDGREREQLHDALLPLPDRRPPPALRGPVLPLPRRPARRRGSRGRGTGQERGGGEHAGRGDALEGGRGHGGEGHGDGAGPGADGEDGADGAGAPAEGLDVAPDVLRGELGGGGGRGARRRRGRVDADGGAARAQQGERVERVDDHRLFGVVELDEAVHEEDLVEEVDGEAVAAVGGEEEDVVLQRQPRPLRHRCPRHGLASLLVQVGAAPARMGMEGRGERHRSVVPGQWQIGRAPELPVRQRDVLCGPARQCVLIPAKHGQGQGDCAVLYRSRR